MSFNDLPFFPVGPSDGVNGKDGVSPTVSVENISGGYRLIIVDATGRKTVDVLNGIDGQQGPQGERGETGLQGPTGEQGPKGDTGSKGDKGDRGDKGEPGSDGQPGKDGTNGKDGANGKSAYEYAKDGGYAGTETEFIELLTNTVDKRNISIGLHTDGLLYLFIDGEPVGTGIEINTSTEA